MLGGHTIKTWATTQSAVALSSGEAEFYGVVKGASALLGLISLAADSGIELKGRTHTDRLNSGPRHLQSPRSR